MRFSPRITGPIGIAAAATLAVSFACSDTPAEPTASPTVDDAAFTMGNKEKPRTLHFARVSSDGTLVSGTAVSADKVGIGVYRVRFPEPIHECAGSASAARFPGADSWKTYVAASLLIGFNGGLATDDMVTLRLFNPIADSDVDTAFTLQLICP